MSLSQKVSLDVEGHDPIEVTFDGRDLRAWETKHRKSSLVEPMSVGMLTWLGWHAAKRTGQLPDGFGDYEAFDAACVGVQGMRDEQDPTKRPTRETQ